MNPDKLLFQLQRDGKKCWHKADPSNPDECLRCKSAFQNKNGEPYKCELDNPSFSDPHHREEFFTWLCRERREMWEMFLSWALRQYEYPWAWEGKTIPWLFFSSPSRPRDLMAEWLQLDSTIERFGYVECPDFNPNPEDVNCLNWNESCHCLNCKVLSPWAQYVKEAK
jgi:hypothetical protein